MKVRRKRAPGPPGGRWLAIEARRLGIATKARTPHERAFGVCPDHLSDELLAAMGFTDRAMFVAYVEALSRQGSKVRASVTLPHAKRPPGVLRVVAKRCPRCKGRLGAHCPLCSNWGWGVRIETRRPRQPAKAAA